MKKLLLILIVHIHTALIGCPCTGTITTDSPPFFTEDFYSPPKTKNNIDHIGVDLMTTPTNGK